MRLCFIVSDIEVVVLATYGRAMGNVTWRFWYWHLAHYVPAMYSRLDF
ncbi:hypothetical protein RR45_GL000105 [Lactococcus chungangensis CAU 28 = DSM 22330]|uniref:Uncharacterized protein n=1 Tax=Pseudolactococcus chungangensis CAU 28 = DSM 22330 TaxID=1122154 RepID=A0ABX4I9N4_9LACT|nr:hypothetical protein RR45_GL000105 [Lactococcus chungangensis CAU 28 = DSM 22330]